MADKTVVVDTAGTAPPTLVSETTGAQVVKGGQKYDDNLFQSIKASYTNVVYNPIIVFFYVLAIAILLFNSPVGGGPLEIMASKFNITAHDTKQPIKAAFGSVMFNLCDMLIDFKVPFAQLILWFLPAALKPSQYNTTFAFGAAVGSYALPSMSAYVAIMLSQAFFLFTQLRKPAFKFMIVMAAIFILLSSFTLDPATVSTRVYNTLYKSFALKTALDEHMNLVNVYQKSEADDDYLYFTLRVHKPMKAPSLTNPSEEVTLQEGFSKNFKIPVSVFAGFYRHAQSNPADRLDLKTLYAYQYNFATKDYSHDLPRIRAKRDLTAQDLRKEFGDGDLPNLTTVSPMSQDTNGTTKSESAEPPPTTSPLPANPPPTTTISPPPANPPPTTSPPSTNPPQRKFQSVPDIEKPPPAKK